MRLTTPDNVRPHWNYFLALEKDLESMSRYIEICDDNFKTYSIEFAHLLLSSASEIDTLAKCICQIIDPNANPRNIDDYRNIIRTMEESGVNPYNAKEPMPEGMKERISDIHVFLPRYNMKLNPWESWKNNQSPEWWRSYNKVKHERNRFFNEATLKNVLNSMAGLLSINYYHCQLELIKNTKPLPNKRIFARETFVTRRMEPPSTLLRFGNHFYDNPIAELQNEIKRVEERITNVWEQTKSMLH